MSTPIVIKNPSRRAIEVIKQSLVDKKKRHVELMNKINPALVEMLKKIPKK